MDELQITGEVKPSRDVHVVEDLELVLGAQPLQAKDRQIEVVFEFLAQIGVPVGNAELVSRSRGEGPVAADAE